MAYQRDFKAINNFLPYPVSHVPKDVLARSLAYGRKKRHGIDYIQVAGLRMYQLRVLVVWRSKKFLPSVARDLYLDHVPEIYEEVLEEIFDNKDPYLVGCNSLNITVQLANLDSVYLFSFPYNHLSFI